MNKCLNCGKEIKQKEGARERKFCENQNACKQAYHNKNKKQPKYVTLKSFQELKAELDKAKEDNSELLAKIEENNKPENKAKIEARRNGTEDNTKKEHKQPLTPVEMTEKPIRSGYKSGFDYSIALAEWKEKQILIT